MKKLSIIIPVYFNEDNLFPLYKDLSRKVLDELPCDYEIVFVDDGSKDQSYEKMEQLAAIDDHIRTVKLSRNFGEHAAVLAGLSVCTGDCAVRKAADLQEPSEMILDMFRKYLEGYKVVMAVRSDREDPWHQKLFSNLYAAFIRKMALPTMPKGGVDTFFIDRQVIDLLVDLKESNAPVTEQILWSGFPTGYVSYVRRKREVGKSRWTLMKKIKMTFDSLLGFSYVPVRCITTIGFLAFFGSILWMVVLIIEKLNGTITIDGYASLSIMILMSFGIIMFSMGILGEYIWRALDAAKKSPPFIIDEPGMGNKPSRDSENEDDL
ncbi:MAG: glycosyltransferase family 2 protein [Lachnospiraceae bacterium]